MPLPSISLRAFAPAAAVAACAALVAGCGSAGSTSPSGGGSASSGSGAGGGGPLTASGTGPCSGKAFGAPLRPRDAPGDVHKYSAAPATQIDTGKLYLATISTAR